MNVTTHQDNLKVKVNEGKSKGMSLFLEVYCNTCKKVVASAFTSEQEKSEGGPGMKAFTINKAAVLAANLCGMGPYTPGRTCKT